MCGGYGFTHHLTHTAFSRPIFHTPTLSRTIFHTTTLSHTFLHTASHSHNFVTHHLSPTISPTQLCHTHHMSNTNFLTQRGTYSIDVRFAWQAWHLVTSTFSLRGSVPQAPCPPRKMKVDVAKCRACQAKRRAMSPSATPATNRGAVPRAIKRAHPRHQSQPVATSATPATQNEGGCQQAPRLPWITKVEAPRLARKEKVNVVKCHACATPAMQKEG